MNTIKAVLVGCGAMSPEWLRSAARIEGLEIVGLVDLREDAARQRQAEFGLTGASVGTNLEAMLEAVKPDVLFDCTVPEAHHDNALLAFKHGVHVLGEKPLAHNLDAARAMVRAARASNRIHAVIQNRRFDPNIRRVRRYLEGGEIGPVTTLNTDFYIGAHFGGFRDSMAHVLLLDMAIHTFDAARLILNADPVSVYCLEWNPQGSWYARDASAMCIFQMSDGSVFNYRGSWCAEGFQTTWESDWRVIGTHGTVRWDGGDHPHVSVVSTPAAGGYAGLFAQHRELDLPALDPQDKIGAHEGVIRDFLEAVRAGTVPETVSHDNIKSLAMVFAAIESAETGQRVSLRHD